MSTAVAEGKGVVSQRPALAMESGTARVSDSVSCALKRRGHSRLLRRHARLQVGEKGRRELAAKPGVHAEAALDENVRAAMEGGTERCQTSKRGDEKRLTLRGANISMT